MTVSQSIIRWLKQFKPEEYSGMKNINTDLQGADACTYVLYKEPIQNVKRYISGRSVHTDHYSIRARLSSQTNSDRIENGAWGELLTDWIEERNKNEDFPVLDKGVVKSIMVTTPFYMGKTETNDSIYQMTISIKYEKRSVANG